MAVDPQVQMILDVMAALPQREISEETPEQFRDVLIGLASKDRSPTQPGPRIL